MRLSRSSTWPEEQWGERKSGRGNQSSETRTRLHREEQKGQQERKEGSSGGFRGASLIEEAQTIGAPLGEIVYPIRGR